MKSSLLARRRRRPEINIVPLMDICVKLIFFFLVTMQFDENQTASTLKLALPKIDTAGKSEVKDHIVVAISKEGAFAINGKPATEQDLAGVVTAVAQVNRDAPVLIMSDEEAPVRFLTLAMDTCRKNGLNKINLQSR